MAHSLAADFELSLFLPFFGGASSQAVSPSIGLGVSAAPFFGYDLPGGLDRRQQFVSQRAEAWCRRLSIYELLRTYPIANGDQRITSDKPDSLVA